MAKKDFVVGVDLNRQHLLNAVMMELEADPEDLQALYYFNTVSRKIRYHDGNVWKDVIGGTVTRSYIIDRSIAGGTSAEILPGNRYETGSCMVFACGVCQHNITESVARDKVTLDHVPPAGTELTMQYIPDMTLFAGAITGYTTEVAPGTMLTLQSHAFGGVGTKVVTWYVGGVVAGTGTTLEFTPTSSVDVHYEVTDEELIYAESQVINVVVRQTIYLLDNVYPSGINISDMYDNRTTTYDIAVKSNGDILVAAGYKVYTFNGSSWDSGVNYGNAQITSMIILDDDTMMIGDFYGKVHAISGTNITQTIELGGFENPVISIIALPNGVKFALIESGKVFRFDGTSWDSGVQLADSRASCMYLLKNGNILVGYNTGTIFKFNGAIWDSGTYICSEAIQSICELSDGRLMTAVYNSIYTYNGTTWDSGVSIISGSCSTIIELPDGSVLAVYDLGLFKYDGITWEYNAPTFLRKFHTLTNGDVIASADSDDVNGLCIVTHGNV
jgi:hypothetical protein